MAEALEDLRAFVAYRVREGFESVHEIVENAADHGFEKHGRDDLRPDIGWRSGGARRRTSRRRATKSPIDSAYHVAGAGPDSR
jgi:hypothetical protein